MDMVYPVHLLRRLGRRNIEINNDRLLVIAHDDTGKWFVLARINLLMGNEQWHVDEVARPSFGNEFKALSPPHPAASMTIEPKIALSSVIRFMTVSTFALGDS